jgi:hypothetical protein
MALKEFAKALGNSLPFMEGREKEECETLLGKVVTIRDYGFMMGTDKKTKEDKEYVAFTIEEDPHCFYFGGQVLTNNMKKIEEEGLHEEVVAEGLPVLFTERKSDKTGNTYTDAKFYPVIKEVVPADNGKGKGKK